MNIPLNGLKQPLMNDDTYFNSLKSQEQERLRDTSFNSFENWHFLYALSKQIFTVWKVFLVYFASFVLELRFLNVRIIHFCVSKQFYGCNCRPLKCVTEMTRKSWKKSWNVFFWLKPNKLYIVRHFIHMIFNHLCEK